VIDPFSMDPAEKTRMLLTPLQASNKAVGNKSKGQTQHKYNAKIFNLNDDTDRLEFEETMTKITNDEDLQYHREETHFSRDGEYLVALRWISEVKKNDPQQIKRGTKKES